MATLKTNYKDDILNTNKNTKRKYNMLQNSDGTVSFEDVTDYTQEGDSFGAKDVNDITKTVNDISSDLEDVGFIYKGAVSEQTLKQEDLVIAELDLEPGFYVIAGAAKVSATSTDYYRLWLSYSNSQTTNERFVGSFVNNISMRGEGGGQTVIVANVYLKARIKLHMYPFMSSGIAQTNKETSLSAIKLRRYIS